MSDLCRALPRVLVPGRVQRLAGFQIALQARQHQRPAATDALERLAAGLELVVNDGELHLIPLRLKLEGYARWRFGFHAGMRCTKRIGKAPRRIKLEYLAGDVFLFTLELEREWRADLPIRDDAIADPVLLRHFFVVQGLSVVGVKPVEERASRSIRQRFEDLIHGSDNRQPNGCMSRLCFRKMCFAVLTWRPASEDWS